MGYRILASPARRHGPWGHNDPTAGHLIFVRREAGAGFADVAATCTGIESVKAILLAAPRAGTAKAEVVVVVRRVVVVAIGRAEVVVVVVETATAHDPV